MLDIIENSLKEEQTSDKMSDKEVFEFEKLKDYLEKNNFITTKEFSVLINKAPSTARRKLAKFSSLGLLSTTGTNKNTKYFLTKEE